MTTGYNSDFFVTWRRYHIPILAFSLVAGMQAGVLICVRSQSLFFPLMQYTASGAMTFLGSIVASFVPILLCVICVRLRVDFLIPVFLLLKGFSLGFTSCLTFRTFGSAGWLIHSLLFSIRHIQLILLLIFCMRFCGRKNVPSFRDMLLYFAGFAGLYIIEFLSIAPFMAEVI